MFEEGVEHLPVVRDGELVGICTRTAVLRARHHQLDLERPQPGWRPPVPWHPAGRHVAGATGRQASTEGRAGPT